MMLYEKTTIAAIATPPGFGGIGVIRLSGENSLAIVRKLLDRTKNPVFQPQFVSFQHLFDPKSNQILDDALITYFQAPHSYTGEDVVEISCHGSPVVQAEILSLLVSWGAQLAQPGEFTLRAFLNQRLDLSQAEAINDLIHAQTNYQAKLAARQLHGELSHQLQPLKAELVEMIVHFESAVEFVEDDLSPLDLRRFQQKLDKLLASIKQMISTYRLGRLVRRGVKLALVGRPNVGKSSIFNALLGRERAIVTNIPGTTRDTLSEVFSLNGIPVELVDTAGIRESDDVVEKLGVARTQTAIVEADFVLAIIEADHQPSKDELQLLNQLPFHFLIVNKCDLGLSLENEHLKQLAQGKPIATVSALTGQGMKDLRTNLHNTLTAGAHLESGIITNERHYQALENTLIALQKAQLDLSVGCSEEIILVNLHEALRTLGCITGETLISDIINQIFSTFCIGK